MVRSKFNPDNERIKHGYFAFLRNAKRLSVASVDQVAAALTDYEFAVGVKDFRLFRVAHAERYQRYLASAKNEKSGAALAKATVSARLAAVKAFFQWLCQQRGYRRLTYSDFEYFNNSARDERIARAVRPGDVASIEQIRHILGCMPTTTDIEKRNHALVAFTLLSGARDDAIASLSVKHIDLTNSLVRQDAREVRTKNAKTFVSWFFPVGYDFRQIVADWIAHLQTKLLWGPNDPLFPATRVALDSDGHFDRSGLDRRHWRSAGAIRKVFKAASAEAKLPYFNPHSFRNTLVILGEKVCKTPEEFKAWSQNLGHTHVLTTFMNYGEVAHHRQSEIFLQLQARQSDEGSRQAASPTDSTMAQFEERLALLEAGRMASPAATAGTVVGFANRGDGRP